MASDNDFKFIMEAILGQREDSPLWKSLKRDGYEDDAIGVATILERYIENLKYQDDSSGNIIMAELGEDYRALIRCFQAFVRMEIDQGNLIYQDWQNRIVKADFQAFSIRIMGPTSYYATQITSSAVSSSSVDNGTDVLLVDDDYPELGSASIVISIDNDDGVDETSNESIVMLVDDDYHGLGSASIVISIDNDDGDDETSNKSIVMLVDNDSPGLGSASIFISTDDDDGVDKTWSEPSGLGLIPSEPRLFTSIVTDPQDDDGIFKIASEPPGLGSASIVFGIGNEPPGQSFRVSDSIEDGVIELGNDGGIKDLLVDDEPSGPGSIPSEPRLSTSVVIDPDDDDGIFEIPSEPPGLDSIPDESIIIETWSEPPGLGLIPSEPLLSTYIDDGVIELDNDGRIDVLITDDLIRLFTSDALDGEKFVVDISVLKKLKCFLGEDEFEETFDDDDGIAVLIPTGPPGHSGPGSILDESIVIETWSEPPGPGLITNEPRLFTSIVTDHEDDDRIFEITSVPPGLGPASIVIGVGNDDGVDETSYKPLRLGSIVDESIVIETWSEPPGLCFSLSASVSKDSWGAVQEDPSQAECTDDPIPSEPPDGLGSCFSSSANDLFDRDHGIKNPVLIPSDVATDDPIPSEPPDGLGSCLWTTHGEQFESDDLFERDDGILPVLIPSDVVTVDPIPSEPPDGFGSHLLSSANDLFERDHRIKNPVSIPSDVVTDDPIPSEPPDGLDSCLSSSSDDLFEPDPGIKNPVSVPSDIVTDDPIPSEPPDGLGSRLSGSHLSTSIDGSQELVFFGLDNEHGIHVATDDSISFEIMSEPPGLGYASIVLDLVEKDGVDESSSEPPGLGLIPSEPRLSTSTVLDFDDDDGTFEIPSEPPGLHATWSEPPGLGLIPSGPRLYDDDDDGIFEISSEPPGLGYALIVLDLVDKDGIDETLSEPPGRGTCLMSSSIDDGIGTDPGEQIKKMADDLFERDAFHDEGIGTTPGEQIKKMPDHGITPVSIPSDVIAKDSIPSKPPDGLGSRLPSSGGDLSERDNGINPVSIPNCIVTNDSIPSKPPDGLGSRQPKYLIEQSVTKLEMGRLRGFNTFHDEGIGKIPGEQIKKISRSSCGRMQARPDSICSVRRGVTSFPYLNNGRARACH
jgi:hypothetical protein